MNLITEGVTKVWVTKIKEPHKQAGPSTAKMPVFYNPVMEFSRDLSILVIERFLQEKKNMLSTTGKVKLLDGLAGSGIRGVRIANEVELARKTNITITINDINPLAYKLILKNIKSTDLKNALATNKDLNSLLSKNRFDYIDIDPFGSPIKFIDASARMLRHNGILAVTATDTAPLFGRYPKTCLRRYDAISARTGFSHELGLRILLGCCVRTAARYNLALKPLLVHATDYYYRIYFRGIKSRRVADCGLDELGYVMQPKNSNEFKIINRNDSFSKPHLFANLDPEFDQSKGLKFAGPLWIGKLYDTKFVSDLTIGSHKFNTKTQVNKMLMLWREEAEAPLGFYDANLLASELRLSSPPLSKIINAISEHGYQAMRTHFNPNGFKTNAGFKDIVQVLKKL